MPKAAKQSKSALYRWAFTWWVEGDENRQKLEEWLKGHCKKWVFQTERGTENGGLHFQGRMSLTTRKRKSEVLNLLDSLCKIKAVHLSEEHEEESSSFYAMKTDTKVAGPWTDKDKPKYVPKAWENAPEMAWHPECMQMLEDSNRRELVLVIDEKGETGKTVLTRKLVTKGAFEVPSFLGGAKDLMRAAYGALDGTDPARIHTLILDIPRSQAEAHKRFWWDACTALEKLKDGVIVEDRYTFRIRYIEPPRILVFTNTMPPVEALSRGRWKILNLQDYEDFFASA